MGYRGETGNSRGSIIVTDKRSQSSAFLLTMAFFVLFSGQVRSQTASTGALTGLVLDPSGAALRGAVVVLTSQETGATESATSNGEGDFSFLLLPGDYEVKASKTCPGSSHRQCDSKRQGHGNSSLRSTSPPRDRDPERIDRTDHAPDRQLFTWESRE
jgi:Carboxypeptidase regulatory-like domain